MIGYIAHCVVTLTHMHVCTLLCCSCIISYLYNMFTSNSFYMRVCDHHSPPDSVSGGDPIGNCHDN